RRGPRRSPRRGSRSPPRARSRVVAPHAPASPPRPRRPFRTTLDRTDDLARPWLLTSSDDRAFPLREDVKAFLARPPAPSIFARSCPRAAARGRRDARGHAPALTFSLTHAGRRKSILGGARRPRRDAHEQVLFPLVRPVRRRALRLRRRGRRSDE